MARLRREEEERTYQRMIQNAAPRETFTDRYPTAPMAHLFAEVNRPSKVSDIGEDTFEYGDIQKQVTLIFNFLVSVLGCGVALWLAARWWSTPARLFLSLGGSIVVAIAEVAVYSAFTWRMSEGERKEQKKREIKEVVNTWVVDRAQAQAGDVPKLLTSHSEPGEENTVRKRTKAPAAS
jgi:TMEM199 family protein